MTRIKLLLVEDHELMSRGLRALLEPEHQVVGIVPDGALALAGVREHDPDLILLDLALPNRSGIEILSDLARAHPSLPVVVVTMHAEPGLAAQVFRLGALGCLSKDCSIDELRAAIREAMEGRQYSSPPARHDPRVEGAYPPGFLDLTARQQEVVRLIGQGLTSEQIAATLFISHWTVHFHRKNIRRLLGIHSDWEMIRYASRIGELEPRPSKR